MLERLLSCLLGLWSSHNQLASVPACLFRLKSLASLALHFNLLESLPEDLGRLHSLVELVQTRTHSASGLHLSNFFLIVLPRTCPTTT